ncbi:hypothetical protein F2Q68_00037289 [Brassica cretica]|uniref:Uncharacterized protein n=1 Tax=Brassica cretica TaxID=69181 RepID=A0A8S9H241_BRACR|nr:hypothetical protein F2Q68_00037289 [Brassica cretica]
MKLGNCWPLPPLGASLKRTGVNFFQDPLVGIPPAISASFSLYMLSPHHQSLSPDCISGELSQCITFLSGYFLTGSVFRNAPDSKALQRTLSYETGMQSSLLALALATKPLFVLPTRRQAAAALNYHYGASLKRTGVNFFQDPLVGIPPAISTVVMSLMGFTLVMIWSNEKELSI